MPIRLVEAEHEGARDAIALHQFGELVVVAHHSVDVTAEVQVRVEDVGARRHEATKLRVVDRAQLLGALEGLAHPTKANRSGACRRRSGRAPPPRSARVVVASSQPRRAE